MKINEIIGGNEREIREEKADVQKLLEEKRSETKDLMTKCEKKLAELEGLQSNNKALTEQLVSD